LFENSFFFLPKSKTIYFIELVAALVTFSVQGCQIFLGTTYQNGKNIPNGHKIYQMATKYTIWPQNIPYGRKIYQMATKYADIFYILYDPPKFTQIGIFGNPAPACWVALL
jgi:hypothetical protein